MRDYRWGAGAVFAVMIAYVGAVLWYRPTPEDPAVTQERTRQAQQLKDERAAKVEEKRKQAAAAAAKVEEALEELQAKGVSREDVKDYFYDEIEEEVCDARSCRD